MRHGLGTLLLAAIAVIGCGKSGSPAPAGAPPSGTPSASPAPGPAPASPQSDAIDPATAGTISGVVTLDGWLKPDVPNKDINGVPACAVMHKVPPMYETLVLGDGQKMANVLVYVKNGLGGRKFEAPKDAVVLDQAGCIYTPHVRALQVNQALTVRNGDALLHNVSFAPALNNRDNRGQSGKGAEDTWRFPIPETGIYFKCDVHPWMSAWVHVMANPFFQVTGKDGAYKLSGLPPGEYEIHAWHERFPKEPMVAMVKLGAKGNVTQDFTFKGGTKPSK